MAFNSNGQISYLILDSLSEGSKYGLEIIEYITSKTSGEFVLKKPTLYSCLQRMEKKGWISSSYWGESELGGKRHYYSITNEGKKNLEILSKEFEGANFSSEENTEDPKQEQLSLLDEEKEENKEFNIYDAVAQNITSQVEEEEPQEDDTLKDQINIFEFQENKEDEELSKEFEETYFPDQSLETEEDIDEKTEEPFEDIKTFEENGNAEKVSDEQDEAEEETESHDDGRLLEESEGLTPFQEEQNRRLYDTSSEVGRYRKKKSFSENQIEMSVVYQQQEDLDAQKQRIAELKQSMLNVKQSGFDNLSKEEKQEEEFKEEKVEPLDDGVFISERKIAENDIPIQRKIMPTNIEINVYDADLPAPKRNSALEPTYKDMLARLFEKKHENDKPSDPNGYVSPTKKFADYDGLEKYYKTKNITFKEYKKTAVQRKHNTNLLNIISSGILFVLSSICSALLFWITSASHHLKSASNFLYILIPILFLGWTVYMFVYYKLYPSKKARLKFSQLTSWIIFVLATLVIFVINILCGMQFETIPDYCTSLFLPILSVLIVLPINYYIKNFIYQKYSK